MNYTESRQRIGNGVGVKARPGEPFEALMKRFKKKVIEEKLMEEIKKSFYFEKPSTKNRAKRARARHLSQWLN